MEGKLTFGRFESQPQNLFGLVMFLRLSRRRAKENWQESVKNSEESGKLTPPFSPLHSLGYLSQLKRRANS